MSKLLLGDVELLATGASGASERFRRRYTKHSGAVGRVDHTIAPAARGNGEPGGRIDSATAPFTSGWGTSSAQTGGHKRSEGSLARRRATVRRETRLPATFGQG